MGFVKAAGEYQIFKWGISIGLILLVLFIGFSKSLTGKKEHFDQDNY